MTKSVKLGHGSSSVILLIDMSWQLLIALSVLLFSINGLLHRVMMKHDKSDAYAQSFAFCALVFVSAFVISLVWGRLQTTFTIDQMFLFIPMVILGSLGAIFAFKGMKLIEASEHTILITSSKLWFLAGTLLVLREAFSLQKIAGGILILVGVTVAQYRKGKLILNSGALYVLMAAFFYAGADITSYLILRNFDALSLVVYSAFFAAVTLYVIRPSLIHKLSFYKKPDRMANIIIVCFNDTLATLFAFTAYQIGRNALQIGPLGATQTIVTVLLALIFLGETDNMSQKLLGAATVVAGAIILL